MSKNYIMKRKLVIGFGTGRCGTKSLAMFIDRQDSAFCSHEYVGAWDTQYGDYFHSLSAIYKNDFPIVGNISAGWIHQIDRLIQDIPNISIILLDRGSVKEVADSFFSYMSESPLARRTDLRGTYPIEERLFSYNAIFRSVDRYVHKQETLLKSFPKHIMRVRTKDLSKRGTQEGILEWIGIDPKKGNYDMPHRNKREDMIEETIYTGNQEEKERRARGE